MFQDFKNERFQEKIYYNNSTARVFYKLNFYKAYYNKFLIVEN